MSVWHFIMSRLCKKRVFSPNTSAWHIYVFYIKCKREPNHKPVIRIVFPAACYETSNVMSGFCRAIIPTQLIKDVSSTWVQFFFSVCCHTSNMKLCRAFWRIVKKGFVVRIYNQYNGGLSELYSTFDVSIEPYYTWSSQWAAVSVICQSTFSLHYSKRKHHYWNKTLRPFMPNGWSDGQMWYLTIQSVIIKQPLCYKPWSYGLNQKCYFQSVKLDIFKSILTGCFSVDSCCPVKIISA